MTAPALHERAGQPEAPKAPGPMRRSLHLLRPHLRGHRTMLAAGVLALLLEVVFRVLEPWPVKFVVDAVTRSLGADVGPGPAASVQLLLGCALATVSIVGLRAVCNYLATVAFALVGSRVATELRQRIFDHLARLGQGFHGRNRTGDTVQRVVSDIGRLQEVAVTAGLPLLANVVTLFAMTGVMLWLDPVLALVVVAACALFWLLSQGSSRKITEASRKTRKGEGALADTVQETLGAIRVVQAYGLADVQSRQFGRAGEKALTEGVKARRLAAGLERRTDVLVGIATAVVLFVGGWRVVQHSMTPGDLVLFLTYLKTAMKPLRDLAKYTGRIARAAASGERVADIADEPVEITDPDRPTTLTGPRGELALHGVSAHWPARAGEPAQPVLRHLDLYLPAGQRVAVVGPSGSGKSTLGSLLVRLIDPAAGSIRLDGVDLRRLRLDELRRHVSLVLQETVLLKGTITENIRHGRLDATDDEVARAAELAQVSDFVTELPSGFDTVVGERGASLSGGQRQRIAIARALLRDSAVVVLDEATTGLDPGNAVAVRAGIETLTRGRTTISITHDSATAFAADRVIWLEDGAVLGDAPPEHLARTMPRFRQWLADHAEPGGER